MQLNMVSVAPFTRFKYIKYWLEYILDFLLAVAVNGSEDE